MSVQALISVPSNIHRELNRSSFSSSAGILPLAGPIGLRKGWSFIDT